MEQVLGYWRSSSPWWYGSPIRFSKIEKLLIVAETVPSRKEINKLTPVELNLFYEGLAKFQNERPYTHPKSWFQIAGMSRTIQACHCYPLKRFLGIHGMPYTTWPNESWNKGPNNVPDRKPPPSGGRKGMDGFCTHSSILFLTWHRPYLALFEV